MKSVPELRRACGIVLALTVAPAQVSGTARGLFIVT